MGLVSAEEFRRTKDIIEKAKPVTTLKSVPGVNGQSLLEKRLKYGQENGPMLQKRKPAVVLDDEVEPDLSGRGQTTSEPKLQKPLLKLAPGAKLLNPVSNVISKPGEQSK